LEQRSQREIGALAIKGRTGGTSALTGSFLSRGNHEEATMRTPQLSALVFAVLTFSAVAAEPQKLWEASGFKQPESVVFDRAAGAIYVSNVNGDPMKKDGNGFISKLGPDGKVVTIEWVKGLDSPTGLALANGKLYAADVDRIAEIDIAKGEIIQRYEAPGSKFLNDLTADKTGRVYASDMVTNSIWVLDGGKLSLLMQDDALDNPNGLLAEDGRLVVASWGKMAPDFSTKVPGHMKAVDLATKKVSALGDSTPAGNFDGVEPDGKGGYLVTDWVSGGLFHVANNGKPTRLLPLTKGSADLGVGPDGIIMIPMMMDGTVVAYKVDTH
jgi:sugar lactone lactonase YvrE